MSNVFIRPPSDGITYELGEAVLIWVNFNRDVDVTDGPPGLMLRIGSRIRQASLQSLLSH